MHLKKYLIYMKKFIIILSAIMVAAVSISAASQRNVYLWKSDGTITVSDPEDIDSLSFSGAHLFNITNTSYGENRTTHSFDASINVAFNFADKTLGGTIEVGVCYSADNVEPTIDDTTITLGSESDYTYTAYLRKLSPSTTYYFRGYVKLLNEVFYGDVASVTTVDAYVIDGHNFMDLGLPSGLLWAESNIGGEYDYDAGSYFSWAETSSKEEYTRATYAYGFNPPTKYNTTDGVTTLEAADDAAIEAWGDKFRTPTIDDFQELITNCTWTWQTNYYGAKGYLVEGPNGNTIFLRAGGIRNNDIIAGLDNSGSYWANSIASDADNANRLYFNKDDNTSIAAGTTYRFYGTAVRAVTDKPTK